MARGHRIEKLNEVPVVIEDKVMDGITSTKSAIELLKTIGAFDDVVKVKDSITIRAGKGKARNRRWRKRRGPLIIFDDTHSEMTKYFRNLPGVEYCAVSRLNILQLAPGGHLGRFIIWTKGAFAQLKKIYGTTSKDSTVKKGFRIRTPMVANPNLSRILQSDEIQQALRPKKVDVPKQRKINPLTHPRIMDGLNPGSLHRRRNIILRAQRIRAKRVQDIKNGITKKVRSPQVQAKIKAKKLFNKEHRKRRGAFKEALLA